MARNPKSIGEMISTLTFFGVGIACVFQALSFHEAKLIFVWRERKLLSQDT